jgi:hypothetical protein
LVFDSNSSPNNGQTASQSPPDIGLYPPRQATRLANTPKASPSRHRLHPKLRSRRRPCRATGRDRRHAACRSVRVQGGPSQALASDPLTGQGSRLAANLKPTA